MFVLCLYCVFNVKENENKSKKSITILGSKFIARYSIQVACMILERDDVIFVLASIQVACMILERDDGMFVLVSNMLDEIGFDDIPNSSSILQLF